MYGGFAHAEALSRGPDGGFVFNDVYRQLTGTLFNIRFQKNHSKLLIQLNI